VKGLLTAGGLEGFFDKFAEDIFYIKGSLSLLEVTKVPNASDYDIVIHAPWAQELEIIPIEFMLDKLLSLGFDVDYIQGFIEKFPEELLEYLKFFVSINDSTYHVDKLLRALPDDVVNQCLTVTDITISDVTLGNAHCLYVRPMINYRKITRH
jgi:hypothetical protein